MLPFHVDESNYGGSEWDNQALFDFSGKALDSLKVFKLVNTGYGTVPDKKDDTEDPDKDDTENLLMNGSFESEDMSMYTIGQDYLERQNDTPKSGQYALHFWSDTAIDSTVEQTVTLNPGVYKFNLSIQGDKAGTSEKIFAYVKNNSETIEGDTVHLDGYAVWQDSAVEFTVKETSQITLGLNLTADAGAWGTTDDWKLVKVSDLPKEDTEPSESTEPTTSSSSEVPSSSQSTDTTSGVKKNIAKKKLPSTGESQNLVLTIAGVILVVLTISVVLLSKKKMHK